MAADVAPAEAALLAGMIASPSLYDPVENPRTAQRRRDLVLARMLEQRKISRAQYEEGMREALPTRGRHRPAAPSTRASPTSRPGSRSSSWTATAPGVVFGGGLKIKTTLDPELQAAAEQAIAGRLAGVGPSASLVAIDNKTGEVKAMVGGTDFRQSAFNLATNGHRQPGSAFKPFTLFARWRTASARRAPSSRSRRTFRPRERAVRGEQLRGQLLRGRVAAHRHRRRRTTPCTRSSA